MPNHKKYPTFIRVRASDKSVVCINPTQLSSFTITEKAKIKTGTKEAPVYTEADTIRFYFPAGTGLTYSVGVDITQEEFDYVCSTLLEYLYLNEGEFEARSKAIANQKMEDWQNLSKENEEKLTPTTKA